MTEELAPTPTAEAVRRGAVGVRATVKLLLALTLIAGAAVAEESVDRRWEPWLGCWQLDAVVEDALASDFDAVRVCVTPVADEPSAAGPAGVEIVTYDDGADVLRETLVADGVQHAVEEEGCRGWRLAEWSYDGERLFLRSELECDDGLRRTASGTSLIGADGGWVDIQASGFQGWRGVVVRHYEPVPAEGSGAEEARRRRDAALAGGLGAEESLSVDDVIEALGRVDTPVIEAALVETASQFTINAATLRRLAEARVPDWVIDLMVALSFPDRFVVEPDGFSVPRETGGEAGGVAVALYPYSFFPYFHSGYYVPYGSSSSFRPVPVPAVAEAGGQAVQGSGYTRVHKREPDAGASGFAGDGGGWSGGGGSSGGVSAGGYSGGGGGTRTARPRN